MMIDNTPSTSSIVYENETMILIEPEDHLIEMTRPKTVNMSEIDENSTLPNEVDNCIQNHEVL